MHRGIAWGLALVVALAAANAGAQDAAEPSRPPEGVEGEAAEPSDAPSADGATRDLEAPSEPGAAQRPSGSEGSEAAPPKIAVIVAGDPEPALRDAARRIERILENRVRVPFDPGLRAALRGEEGERDDGLEEVRRERRRLGLDEARDALLLATLGRRAGASAVAVVRAGTSGHEVVVLDVRNAAFFEGALPVDTPDERLARFVIRRARVAARGSAVEGPVAEHTPPPADVPQREEQPQGEPDLFGQMLPYVAAGALLVGMIIAIVLSGTSAGAEQPVLRFGPGGR
jgi:hypothetical protein